MTVSPAPDQQNPKRAVKASRLQNRGPANPSRCQETERTAFFVEKPGRDGSIPGACNRRNAEDDFLVYDFKKLSGALRTVSGIHGQAPREHVTEKKRQVADMDSRRDQRFAAQPLDTLSWRITAYSLVNCRTQTIDISGGSERAAADLLLGR